MVNVVVVLCTGVTTIFFNFPIALPTTSSTMSMYQFQGLVRQAINVFQILSGYLDYTSVILGIALLLGNANWLLHARKHYQGPQLELAETVVGSE